MLFALKDNNTTGSIDVCFLLHVLSVIIKSVWYVQVCIYIYKYYMCKWHGNMYVPMYAIGHCVCAILLAIYALAAVCIYMSLLQNYR